MYPVAPRCMKNEGTLLTSHHPSSVAHAFSLNMSKMNPAIKMTDYFRKTRRETKQNSKQKNFSLAARALILCSPLPMNLKGFL